MFLNVFRETVEINFSLKLDKCWNKWSLTITKTKLEVSKFYFFKNNVDLESLKTLFINLFTYLFLAVLVFVSVQGFLRLRRAGATLHHGERASHCRGLSRCGAQAPNTQAQ